MSAHQPPRAAYIHVPFCARRCGYCDFTLVAGRDELVAPYLRALAIELKRLEWPREVDSVFFGGGTPTHLSADQLSTLLSLVFKWLPPAPGCEVSIEANPSGLTSEKLDTLVRCGVTRVSLGVQSFDDAHLSFLGRDHVSSDAIVALNRLQERFENISLDLIFGIPGQTVEDWRLDLQTAVAIQPRHLSTYGLTYEKGAAFWSLRRKRRLQPASEEDERMMYAAAMDELTAAGYEQYEVSNFAQPGFRCRHNEVYWAGNSYYAFGPGAARYVNGRRETNHRSVATWIKRTMSGQSAVADAETLSPETRARELIFLGLRRNEGLERNDFTKRSGFSLETLVGSIIQKHCELGLLEDTGTHVRLTREGRFLADSVIVDFM